MIRIASIAAFAVSLAPLAHAQGTPAKPSTAAAAAADTKPAGAGESAKQRQVFILPQSGTVGVGLRAAEMEKVEKAADKFGPGQIIVLRINSPGGLLTEVDKINVVLNRVREKHRLVAWLEEAISAAAVTAMHCREIYFMNLGSMGSATAYAGDKSMTGPQLDAWLKRISEIAEAGGRNGQVAKCMVYSPLVVSYTRDPKTKKVTFFPDASGEKMLSDDKDNLTLTADQALDCGYSNGTANTEAELFALMQLQPGAYAVNEEGRKIGEGWRKSLESAERQRKSLQQDWSLAGDDAKGLQKRVQICKQMQDIWRKAEPVAMGYDGGGPLMPEEAVGLAPDLLEKFQSPDANRVKLACELLDRLIKDYQRQIADLKKGQG